jgi:hypothetical protein
MLSHGKALQTTVNSEDHVSVLPRGTLCNAKNLEILVIKISKTTRYRVMEVARPGNVCQHYAEVAGLFT